MPDDQPQWTRTPQRLISDRFAGRRARLVGELFVRELTAGLPHILPSADELIHACLTAISVSITEVRSVGDRRAGRPGCHAAPAASHEPGQRRGVAACAALTTPPSPPSWSNGSARLVHVGDMSAQIDEQLAPVIEGCWRNGFTTLTSRQDAGESNASWVELLPYMSTYVESLKGWAFIDFPIPTGLDFLSAVANAGPREPSTSV